MNALYGLCEGLYGFSESEYNIKKGNLPLQVNGCSESQFVHFVMSISKNVNQRVIITYSDKRAR